MTKKHIAIVIFVAIVFSSVPYCLSVVSWWGSLDIFFTLLVLLGVVGEVESASKWVIKVLLRYDVAHSESVVKWEAKKLHKRAEWLLVVGLSGELACLGFSIFESADVARQTAILQSNNLVLRSNVAILEIRAAQISNSVVKIDPLNQPISDVSIVATIKVMGLEFSESPLWGSAPVAYAEICDCRTNVGGGAIYSSGLPLYSTMGEFSLLSALDFKRMSFRDIQSPTNGCHGYIIRFEPQGVLLGSEFFVSYPPTVGDMVTNVKALLIDTKFIPHNSELEGGSAFMIVNGSIRVKFDILPQKAYENHRGLGDVPGNSGFTLVATNAVLARLPERDRK